MENKKKLENDVNKKLVEVQKVVYSCMLDDERCRKDDDYLYGKAIETIASNKGIPINNDMKAVIKIFKQSNNPALLNYATVKRSRQRIQELSPELRSNEQRRKELEEIHRLYYSPLK